MMIILFAIIMVMANLGLQMILDEGLGWPNSARNMFCLLFSVIFTWIFIPYFLEPERSGEKVTLMLRLKKAISMVFTAFFLGLAICFWQWASMWGSTLAMISPVFALIFLILGLYMMLFLCWWLFDKASDFWIKYANQTRS